MLKKTVKFILIILVMFVIFSFSSDNSKESSKKSDKLITKVTEIVLKRKLSSNEEKKYINKYVVIVRKTAHFIIYLTLGILVLSFIREFRCLDYKSLVIAIIICFLYACSDEFHQLFVSGRSGEIKDVLLDTIGASLGCLIYNKFNKIRR